ncbi:MAG: glycosyltransferase family 2 protein, partial [Candidatus Bathyarchaeota archaeon]
METTLVVPVKNEVNTIQECVQSILNQTYKDFEVIFVDGGSTDGTYEILDSIRKEESRIKVLREPGLGP